MTQARIVFAFSIVCLAIAFAPQPSELAPEAATSERLRIQRHLERVEVELLARDVTHLSDAQRGARAKAVSDLHAYRVRGRFPHNHHRPARTPCFVDRHGTRCALAHLIQSSGHGDLVRAIASTRNLARVAELADDVRLQGWLTDHGLSMVEAGRIQPEYGPYSPRSDPLIDDPLATTIAGVQIVLGATTTAVNYQQLHRPRGSAAAGLLGMTVGFTGIIVGISEIASDRTHHRIVGPFNLGLGLCSFGMGLGNLGRAAPPRRVSSDGSAESIGARISPAIAMVDGRPALTLRMTF